MKRIIFITALFIVITNYVNAQTDTVYVPAPKDTVYVAIPVAVPKDTVSVKEVPADDNESYNHDALDRFQFGFRAGANYSNIYDVSSETFAADYKFGFAGGIFMSIPIGKVIGIQPEILYSEKGYEATGSIDGLSYTNTVTSKYLDIPIYLQIKTSEVLTVLFGPQFSWLLDKDNDFSDSFLSDEQEQDFDNIDISKFTFGLSGGLDFNFGHVVLGGRMGWDLTQNNGGGTAISPQYRNLWYQATLGFRF